MVEYLEGVRKGEFQNGTLDEVRNKVEQREEKNPSRVPPTMTMPKKPVTFSEWNEETFVYGHFAMVVPTRHAIFPNAWEHLAVRKDKHHF